MPSVVAVRDSSSLRRRVPTAMVYGAVVLASIHFGEMYFLLAVVAGAVLAYYELWRLFARATYAPSLPGGLVLVLTFLLIHYFWSRVRLQGLDVSFEAGLFFAIVGGTAVALALIVGGALARSRSDSRSCSFRSRTSRSHGGPARAPESSLASPRRLAISSSRGSSAPPARRTRE